VTPYRLIYSHEYRNLYIVTCRNILTFFDSKFSEQNRRHSNSLKIKSFSVETIKRLLFSHHFVKIRDMAGSVTYVIL